MSILLSQCSFFKFFFCNGISSGSCMDHCIRWQLQISITLCSLLFHCLRTAFCPLYIMQWVCSALSVTPIHFHGYFSTRNRIMGLTFSRLMGSKQSGSHWSDMIWHFKSICHKCPEKIFFFLKKTICLSILTCLHTQLCSLECWLQGMSVIAEY